MAPAPSLRSALLRLRPQQQRFLSRGLPRSHNGCMRLYSSSQALREQARAAQGSVEPKDAPRTSSAPPDTAPSHSAPTQSATSPAPPSAATPPNVPTKSFWERLGPISRGLDAYGRTQRRRPYLTQFVGALVVYVMGDLSAQAIGGEAYDPKRTLRMMVIGGVAAVPTYKWFMFLEHHFNYASRAASLATKIVVNQVCFTPVISCYFFGGQTVLAGGSVADAWERIRTTVPTTYRNALMVGPAVTLVNFAFIVPHFRALFSGMFAVAWQTYLSWMNRHAEKGRKQQAAGHRGRTESATAKA